MTDQEALEELLRRFGLTPVSREAADASAKDLGRAAPDLHGPWDDRSVVLEAKHGGVDGYSGCHAHFRFHPDGSFDKLHIWE